MGALATYSSRSSSTRSRKNPTPRSDVTPREDEESGRGEISQVGSAEDLKVEVADSPKRREARARSEWEDARDRARAEWEANREADYMSSLSGPQREFLDSLSPEQRKSFIGASSDEKNAMYQEYAQKHSETNRQTAGTGTAGGQPGQQPDASGPNATMSLLGKATESFGPAGVKYLVDNYDVFDSNLASSGLKGGVTALSSYLSTGDIGEGAKAGAVTFGQYYADNYVNEEIANYIQSEGEAAYLSAGGAEAGEEAVAAGNEAANKAAEGWGIGGKAAAAGVIQGVGTWAATGDAKEGVKAGAKAGAQQYGTQVLGKAIGSVPVAGGIIAGGTAIAEGEGARSVRPALEGVAWGVNPAVGAAFTAVGLAADSINRKEKKKSDNLTFKIDDKTGKVTYGLATGANKGLIDQWHSLGNTGQQNVIDALVKNKKVMEDGAANMEVERLNRNPNYAKFREMGGVLSYDSMFDGLLGQLDAKTLSRLAEGKPASTKENDAKLAEYMATEQFANNQMNIASQEDAYINAFVNGGGDASAVSNLKPALPGVRVPNASSTAASLSQKGTSRPNIFGGFGSKAKPTEDDQSNSSQPSIFGGGFSGFSNGFNLPSLQ